MSSLNTRFDAADDLTVLEITDYRSFFFPPSVCELNGEVDFSLADAPEWMTACGYRWWQEHDPTKRLDRSFHPDNALLKEFRGYRDQIIGPAYLKHPFFGLDRAKEWVLPAPFATYKQAIRERHRYKIYEDAHAKDLRKPIPLLPAIRRRQIISGLVVFRSLSLSLTLRLTSPLPGAIPFSLAISLSVTPQIRVDSSSSSGSAAFGLTRTVTTISFGDIISPFLACIFSISRIQSCAIHRRFKKAPKRSHMADARGRRVVGIGLRGASSSSSSSSSASPTPMPPTHFLAKSTSGFSGQRAAKLVIHKSIESGIGARQASVWSIASEEAHEKEVHKEVHEEIHEEVHEEEWYLFVGGDYRAMRH
ncbi:hypothetical protein FB451DRAFT_1565632 [Mycena latifolia]|nr:hypothetical protein FB451DRAFT_1565632 [Mycena latifolia]